MFESNGPVLNFRGFGFKSANDCPHRDPDEVKISTFDSVFNQWVPIATCKLNFTSRWQTLQFPGIHGSTRSLIFDFVNKKGHTEIQLGEIILYE